MALAQPRRDSIYRKLVPVLGEEDAEALLAQFPLRESAESATCAYVNARIAEVRANIAELRADIVEYKAETGTAIAELSARMQVGFAKLTAKMDV